MLQATMRKKNSGEAGFTLVELLIVIVILGVLSAVVVFAVGGITDKGTKSACNADVKTVETAEEAHYAKNGAYASLPALVNAKLLRSAPSSSSYAITADATTGVVTAAPLCSTL
jgi:prepilin-type N-terminal cleavage/methylation domain-containing protein